MSQVSQVIWLLQNLETHEVKPFLTFNGAANSLDKRIASKRKEIAANVWEFGKSKFKLWLSKIEDSVGTAIR